MNYSEEIKRLKKEKNAVILAHYYQEAEIQDIADYLGDSLNLAKIAIESNADIIVFCGVHFMAETAKILNPRKKVLLPVMKSGCLMADMITPAALKRYKEEHPNTKIITYVNSPASVKALSDCICTSTNALKIINHYLDQGESILYCPDQNLGKYAMKLGGKNFDVWEGCCPIHHHLDPKKIIELKEKYPAAKVLVHPECQESIVKLADYAGSTKQLLDYAIQSEASIFIIATEKGVIHAMEQACPNKTFILASPSLSCRDMKYTTLKDVYEVLNHETNEIFVDDTIAVNAKKALDEMFRLS
ncbi:MAG: quinolinate synthase NadA [Anaeroplasmataceae bacterium]|nr:quinolinate synthase NadA [Anaeroplasmataceae bacterium]MDE6415154.1 quinolinate synthase NadA [Anaeroplasmataceae bacterium]